MKITFVVTATGAYFDHFFEELARSILDRAFPDHEVDVICLTDRPAIPIPGVLFVETSRLGWPLDSLLKFHRILDLYPRIDGDYIFSIDADMMVVQPLSADVLSQPLCAVLHPSFVRDKWKATFEADPRSAAFVPPEKRLNYYQGCLFGGQRSALRAMLETSAADIEKDLARGVIAVWHDESYLNKFASENAIYGLDPRYATLGSRDDISEQAIVMHLHKENDLLRGEPIQLDVDSICKPGSETGVDAVALRRFLNVQMDRLSVAQRQLLKQPTTRERLKSWLGRYLNG